MDNLYTEELLSPNSNNEIEYNNATEDLRYEASDEDKIDSDVEIALYSQIHHLEDLSYASANSDFNLTVKDDSAKEDCLIVKKESEDCVMTNSENNSKSEIHTIQKSCSSNLPESILLSTSSDTDDIQFVCEVKKDDKPVPVITVTDSPVNKNIKNKQRKWWQNFISTIYSDESDDNDFNEENTSIGKIQKYSETLNESLTNEKSTTSQNITNRKRKRSPLLSVKNTCKLHSTTSPKLPKKRLKVEEINISSSSGEENFLCSNSSMKSDILINVTSTNTLMESNKYDESLWYVNSKDLYPSKAASRYYNKQINMLCFNCLERGHPANMCKKPRKPQTCFICGDIGHRGGKCLNSVCVLCLTVGHSAKKCHWSHVVKRQCDICYMQGHFREECPDLWRRYHLTTKIGPIVTGNSHHNTNIFCYNCAQRGHFGFECKKRRMDLYSSPAMPFIMNYSNPLNTDAETSNQFKERKTKSKKAKNRTVNKIKQKFKSSKKQSNNSMNNVKNKLKKKKLNGSSINCDLQNNTNLLKKVNITDDQSIDFPRTPTIKQNIQHVTDFINTVYTTKTKNKVKEQRKVNIAKKNKNKRKRERKKMMKSLSNSILANGITNNLNQNRTLLSCLVPEISFSLSCMKYF